MTLQAFWRSHAIDQREALAREREELAGLVEHLEATAWGNCWDEAEGEELLRAIEAFVELVIGQRNAAAVAAAWRLGGWEAIRDQASSMALRRPAFLRLLDLAMR